MKVLVSGFVPFANHQINPTEHLIEDLLKFKFDFELIGIILPVSYQSSFESLNSAIVKNQPDVIVATGLAAHRKSITPERIAINCQDSSMADNDGLVLRSEKIDSMGEDGLFSTLPIEKMVEASMQAGIEAKISNSAGTYVCNSLMFRLQQLTKNTQVRSGFIHVPPTYEMSDEAEAMPREKLAFGMRKMLTAL